MPHRLLLLCLLLLSALPCQAQTATVLNFFRIANGGYTPIPNNPALTGQNVFFRFRLDDATNGRQAPTGAGNITVFQDGAVLFTTRWIQEGNGGTNTFNRRATDHFPVGEHTFSAIFTPANSTYSACASGPLYQAWGPPAGPETATQLTSTKNPSALGESYSISAQVVGLLNNPVTGGSVRFTINGVVGPTVSVTTTGSAVLPTAPQTAGNHTIEAAYLPDAGHAASTANPLIQTISFAKLVPNVTLSTSADPSEFGQPVTLTAVVNGSGAAPTGTGQFTFAGADLGAPVTLTNGTARLDVPAANLTVGFHAATFRYTGDANYQAVNGTLVGGQVVDQGSTTTTVVSSANVTLEGTPITCTATVVAASPASGTPTGNVIFSVNGAPNQTVPLTSGVANFTTSLPRGSHSIQAAYAGSSDFTASSGAVTEVVNAPAAPPISFPPATFGVSLAKDRVPRMVAPGTLATFYVRLTNLGNQNDSYRLTVSGDPRAHLLGDVLAVGAGGSGEVLVGLTLPPNATPGSVQLQLTAVSERVSTEQATLTLTTEVAGQANFTLSLREGWNGVGFETGALTSLSANPLVVALAQLHSGAYEVVPFGLSSVPTTSEGYWVYAQGPTTVSYTGSVVGDGVDTLVEGWNLVAFPGDGPEVVEANPDVLPTFYEIQADSSYTPVERTVRPGRAYWVFARRPTQLFYAR